MIIQTIEDVQDLVKTWNERSQAVLDIARLLYKLDGDEQFVYDWGVYQSKDEKEPHIWLQYTFCDSSTFLDDVELPRGEEIRFPVSYLLMSQDHILDDWHERQEEEQRLRAEKCKRDAEQFRKDYERYQELKARFECMDKSVGTPEECCGTCGHKIWGAGPKDDGYLICTDKHEVRTRHSVCLDWVPEEEKPNDRGNSEAL